MSTLSEAAVREGIYEAIRNLNEERPTDAQIPLSTDTCLFGAESALDSLALVSAIVDIEASMGDLAGAPISLTDDRAMNRQPVPFTDVQTLTDYVLEITAD